ncbi:MAG: bifunctional diaminohydroxyphosphoribosylaminopyrimidine deaminase/5-amino-6-(5-phosphoribosylamino)uracil reductase RibD, partial [Chitinophagaceae bacterium]
MSILNDDEQYMLRCLQLAGKAEGMVAPNPMVGAVLVYEDRIIGEGFHMNYGEAHAEVNCFNSVKKEDEDLIPSSTLYVSLEPCAHFGKTPPCADLIIVKKVKKVVVGCQDPFHEVKGKGIDKLKAAGIRVEMSSLEKECRDLNKTFFTFHTLHRPYIILKWAQTADLRLDHQKPERLLISNAYTNRLVHQWRSQTQSLLVGTNTALADNPQLTTRLWRGKNPVRLVVDMDLQLQHSLNLFNDEATTIVFNIKQHTVPEDSDITSNDKKVYYYQVTEDVNLVHQMLNALYKLKIQSL